MSRFLDALPPHPVPVPNELAAAWDWMEAQGYGSGDDDRPLLTAYAGRRVLGPVFDASLAGDGRLEAWFGADSSAGARLRPIAEAAGDGSVLALWQDDDGGVRAVVLGSDGDAGEVARTPLELLQLLAVGYRDVAYELGAEPEEQETVDAVADFRTWVTSTYGVEVPQAWPPAEEDEFTTWVARELGEDVADESPAGSGDGTGDAGLPPEVAGDLAVLLAAIGAADGSPEVVAAAEVLGIPLVDGGLRKATHEMEKDGVEVELERGALATIWLADPPLGRLVDALPDGAGVDDVLALLGEPERRSEEHGWIRWAVGDRFLHLTLAADGGFSRMTLMQTAP